MYEAYRHLAENLGLRLSTDPNAKSEAFDDVFAVRSENTHALDEELRGRLLGLHREHAAPSMRGGEIALRVPASVEPASVPRLLESLVEVLALTDRKLRGATAYR